MSAIQSVWMEGYVQHQTRVIVQTLGIVVISVKQVSFLTRWVVCYIITSVFITYPYKGSTFL